MLNSNWLKNVAYGKLGILAQFLLGSLLSQSVTKPAPIAAISTYDSANVVATVTDVPDERFPCPACHGINVNPSGRLPSRRLRPDGSLEAGMSADVRARQMMSFDRKHDV